MAYMSRYIVPLAISSLAILMSGCMTTPKAVRTSTPDLNQEIYDPFEGFNRKVFGFNEGLDKYVINPVTKGYKAILPRSIRKSVSNVTKNLREPVTFLNEVLQADFKDASDTVGRFMVNSTVGLGGLIDVAGNARPTPAREDFGQTLATYNAPQGPYLVIPILGPSNVRDVFGRVADRALTPFTWTEFDGEQALRLSSGITSGLQTRITSEPFLENIRSSADPYVNLRGLYTQNRLNNIHEDADPFDSPDEFDETDDGFADFDDIDDGFADFE